MCSSFILLCYANAVMQGRAWCAWCGRIWRPTFRRSHCAWARYTAPTDPAACGTSACPSMIAPRSSPQAWLTRPPAFSRKLSWPYLVCMKSKACLVEGVNCASAQGEAVCLTPGLLSATSPRFSPDGKLLVFLSHEAAAVSGVHNATAALLTLPWPPPGAVPHILHVLMLPARVTIRTCFKDAMWATADDPTAARRTVVPVKLASREGSVAGADDSFPGIYALALAEQPFLHARTLLLSTQWRSQQCVIAVDLVHGRVQAGCMRGSQALLACAHGTFPPPLTSPHFTLVPPESSLIQALCVSSGCAAVVDSAPNSLPYVLFSQTRDSAHDGAATWPPSTMIGLLPVWTPRAVSLLGGCGLGAALDTIQWAVMHVRHVCCSNQCQALHGPPAVVPSNSSS